MKSRHSVIEVTTGHPGDKSILEWRKSSRSLANGNCVQVAGLSDSVIRVRNSRDVTGPVLEFTATGWDVFLAGVRNGEFDWT